MCGIVGIVARSPVNQPLYDGLLLLQHRGQDAAGIVTSERNSFHMHKAPGMVRDVFRTRNMRSLPGNMGIAHCRYPTAGSAFSSAEAQPFYVNSPFGIVLGHNGNLTNSDQLKEEMFRTDLRHINTGSDSEVLVNVLAHELEKASDKLRLEPQTIFTAIANVHRRVKGAYAVVAMIAGNGVLAFRDPYGIRPAVIGYNDTLTGTEYMVASESVAVDALGFRVLRDIGPGEAVFIDEHGNFHSQQCAPNASLNPCIFEYVYLARPDSLIDGASVYETRLNMGEKLAEKIRRQYRSLDVDVVIPIPDSSRPSALQLAAGLGVPYREGFVKNRYIGGRLDRPRHDQPRDRADGARIGRAQGVLRLGGAAGALPQRLRHRHADPRRADRRASQRGGGGARDRRRCAHLPGPRRAEGRGAPRQSEAEELRDLLLRRALHHGGYHQRLPARHRDPARCHARLGGRRRKRTARFEPRGLIY